MREELEKIREIETYLQGAMNDAELKKFEERIRTDNSLADDVVHQKILIDRIIFQASRKTVIDAGHRFNAKANPLNNGLKSGFISITVVIIALVTYYFITDYRISTENQATIPNPELVSRNETIQNEVSSSNIDTVKSELQPVIQIIDTTVNKPAASSKRDKSFESSKISPPITIDMVEIEGGLFDLNKDHALDIKTFELSKHEITQEQWHNIMGENPSHFQDCDRCPVENVSWDDVQVFIRRLNQRTNSNYRLPTHPEWAFTVRGGTKRKGFMYYKDKMAMRKMAWCVENSVRKTHEVGLKKPNELGIYDLNGNVWEWVGDVWPDDYDAKIKSGHNRSEDKSDKILIGGSYGVSSKDFYLVWYLPEFAQPNVASPNLGFRLARSIEK